jgi:protein required for attachment to host cells
MTEQDAKDLKQAMKGLGTDEDTIIKIVANRTQKQRVAIKNHYQKLYNKDLIKDLKGELNGKLETAIVALFKDPIEYDVETLKNSMKGAGTDEDTLIEVLISRPPEILEIIKKEYKKKYNKELVDDVKSDIKGDLQKLLVPVINGTRSKNTNPNTEECKKYAEELYEAGEKKAGTNEAKFVEIFSKVSPSELIRISQEYHKAHGKNILEVIDKEFSGNMKKALRTIVYAIISPSEYFATRVKEAIKGFGTDDSLLMRVLITRDEIDMNKIKQYYKQLYKKDMVEDIKNDIGGDYRKLMVELCSH